MVFHENCLPADNYHEISCLFVIFEKGQKLKWSSAANCRWRFMGIRDNSACSSLCMLKFSMVFERLQIIFLINCFINSYWYNAKG